MPRVKRGPSHVKHRKNILRRAKGFKWGRKKKLKQAKTAVTKAGVYARRDRRAKKGDFRRLWQIKISASAHMHGTNYARFIHSLKQGNITLNRKMLAELAEHEPKVFEHIVNSVKK
ncbi:MAG: 50S ribosomal protein L20 [Candidatus Komeilibacteria bacterium RIFCSPLOWO2_01_FULL_53_11]|uniref:Large ribosomal subunit protein bL20 n=1 Tax=Candidatus Komeilibacteria bacterium RIFCSPLOWO2_01_FULL_53_11 TaxID=1798552 RepID=A0A1G2BRE1_9BACT|nr:MAG: 50S ribosomal protein L20 [Candidatus Komeilibacteria bacterium RIFCSPLOWO2_01_FULL_53_11]